MALTMQRYQNGHRIFDTLLKPRRYHRLGDPQFSGMILACFLGGRTPVVLKLPHDYGEWVSMMSNNLLRSSSVFASV